MESASLSNETDVIVWEQMDWRIHEKIYHSNTSQRFLALILIYTVRHNRVNRSTHYNTKCDPQGKAVYSKVMMTDGFLEVIYPFLICTKLQGYSVVCNNVYHFSI